MPSNDTTLLDDVRDDPVLRGRGLVVEGILGEGGSSIVLRARDTRHQRDVAIKVMRRDPALERAEERFAREVRVAAGLRHAHILPLYDSGALADGRVFAVMPVARGRPLRAMIDEGPLAVADAVRLAREVAEALAYLHEQGYAHRDVKPENVLVESGHAVLTDFGLAVGLETPAGPRSRDWLLHAMQNPRLTDAGSAVGTLAYMSPEALMGHDVVDARTDVYALGLLLFEMLVGELPLHGGSAPELLAARARGSAPSLRESRPDVPPALDAIVQRCTAPEPDARYQGAAELVRALSAVLESPVPRPSPTRPRDRLLVSLPVVALIASLGLGALLWHRARRETELDPQRIVVADLVNDTGDPALARIGTLAGDVITAALAEHTRLGVVNAVVTLPSRQQRTLPVADSVLAIRTRELVTSTRAGLVVTGAYFRAGAGLEVIAEVTDARSGRVLGVAGPVHMLPDDPDPPLRAVGDRVVEILRLRHAPPA